MPNEPQNDHDYDYDSGPDMQEWFDFFDHDRNEMSNHFGDDYLCNIVHRCSG